MQFINGDCLEKIKSIPDSSVDSVVTDPPYGLKFMNKHWDHSVPSVEFWAEVLRVLKPGGHVLSFGGTRTYHRMAVNIEDAGFEIRDQIMWLYGSGFPKSYNISKGIDKKFGTKGEQTGKNPAFRENQLNHDAKWNTAMRPQFQFAPGHDLAKEWDGFGTALKPANEPIVLARKPLSEKTIVDNVLKWGTGGLNIDGCRISSSLMPKSCTNQNIKGNAYKSDNSKKDRDTTYNPNAQGRFPANIILDEVAGEMLDEQSGVSVSRPDKRDEVNKSANESEIYGKAWRRAPNGVNDKGGASRFFYCAKASKSERGKENNHPTVKPIKLMQYLVRLVTPPGGTVLDPFMGSGTTGLACQKEKFNFIGIEKEQQYFDIAVKRIKALKHDGDDLSE